MEIFLHLLKLIRRLGRDHERDRLARILFRNLFAPSCYFGQQIAVAVAVTSSEQEGNSDGLYSADPHSTPQPTSLSAGFGGMYMAVHVPSLL